MEVTAGNIKLVGAGGRGRLFFIKSMSTCRDSSRILIRADNFSKSIDGADRGGEVVMVASEAMGSSQDQLVAVRNLVVARTGDPVE